jgi:hypothetical protein
MPIYWTIRSVPEVKGISREKRNSLVQACYPRVSREKPVRLATLACVACAALSTLAAADLAMAMGASIYSFFLTLFVGALIGGAIGGLIFGVVLANQVRPFLREVLAAESAPTPS